MEQAAAFYDRVFGAPFRETVDLQADGRPSCWVVRAARPAGALSGDVLDPDGNVLNLY